MAVTKGQQLVLYFLFSTPSQFRWHLEGMIGFPDGTAPPGAPANAADFHARLKSQVHFLGIPTADLPLWTAIDSIFVGPRVDASGNPDRQSHGISTDVQEIIAALRLRYSPGDPCPSDAEQTRLAVGIATAIPDAP